jgi:prepilin-type N-terminal cleavage/methylation domain-containing protein
MFRMRRNAFTLVELLIVVIIIGILAAVAIPQFGNSATDAKLAALDANLATLRGSVELYYHQHGSTYPGIIKTHKVAAAAAAAHASVGEAFSMQLTQYSDASGNTADTAAAAFPYGPYLRRGIPKNPLAVAGVTDTDAATVVTDAGPITADGSPTTGWKFSSTTGMLIANNGSYDDR